MLGRTFPVTSVDRRVDHSYCHCVMSRGKRCWVVRRKHLDIVLLAKMPRAELMEQVGFMGTSPWLVGRVVCLSLLCLLYSICVRLLRQITRLSKAHSVSAHACISLQDTQGGLTAKYPLGKCLGCFQAELPALPHAAHMALTRRELLEILWLIAIPVWLVILGVHPCLREYDFTLN